MPDCLPFAVTYFINFCNPKKSHKSQQILPERKINKLALVPSWFAFIYFLPFAFDWTEPKPKPSQTYNGNYPIKMKMPTFTRFSSPRALYQTARQSVSQSVKLIEIQSSGIGFYYGARLWIWFCHRLFFIAIVGAEFLLNFYSIRFISISLTCVSNE